MKPPNPPPDTKPTPKEKDRLPVRPILAGILLLGLLLRIPGHFYPVTFHYDEGVELDSVVNRFPPGGSLRHPMLNRYLILAVEGVYFLSGRLAGDFRSVAEFGRELRDDPAPFLYVGRVVSLLAGLVTILLTYKLGRIIGGVPIGCIGALLLAVSPGHILVSNNLRMWSLATCLAALALIMAARVESSEGRRSMIVAGLVVGLAIASIYTLGLLLLPLAAAIFMRRRANRERPPSSGLFSDLLVASGGTAAGFFVGNIGALLRWRGVTESLANVAGRDSAGSLSGYATNAGWYASSLFSDYGMGPVLASVAAAGILFPSWWTKRGSRLLALFLLCVFLIQPALLYLWAGRYVVPAYPVLVLSAATILVRLGGWSARASSRFRLPVIVAGVSLFVALNLLTVIPYLEGVRRTPTRELAREWVETHLPSNTKIALNIPYVSPVLRERTNLPPTEAPRVSDRPRFVLAYLPLPGQSIPQDATAAIDDSLSVLLRDGFTHFVYTDPIPPAEKIRRNEHDYVRSLLDARHPVAARFHYADLRRLPDDTALLNPEVIVYTLSESRDDPSFP